MRSSRFVAAAATMSVEEARFLVDLYYCLQDDRKAADSQVGQMAKEPHGVLAWLADQAAILRSRSSAHSTATSMPAPDRAVVQSALRHRAGDLGRASRPYRHHQVPDCWTHLALCRARSDGEVGAKGEAALECEP